METIIAIIVMAILATFAVVRFSGAIENQKARQGVKLLYDLYSAQKRYFIDNSNYASTFAQLNAVDINVKNPPFPGYVLAVSSSSSSLATFTRTTNTYTLTINDTGGVTCTSGTCPSVY